MKPLDQAISILQDVLIATQELGDADVYFEPISKALRLITQVNEFVAVTIIDKLLSIDTSPAWNHQGEVKPISYDGPTLAMLDDKLQKQGYTITTKEST